MLSFLSFIPILGKVFDVASAYLSKKQDVDLEKYKVKGAVDTEAMRQDTEIIKARTELAIATKEDPVNRWGRRLLVYPVGAWVAAISYYCIFHNLIPSYTWVILDYPSGLSYLPLAVVGYLLVTVIKK